VLGDVLGISSGFADWEGGLGQEALSEMYVPLRPVLMSNSSFAPPAPDSNQFHLHTNLCFCGDTNFLDQIFFLF